MYLVDTDHFSILQQRSHPDWPRLSWRMHEQEPTDFFVSVISFQEQVSGWNTYLSRAKSERDVIRAYQMFERVLNDFSSWRVLPFDETASEVLNH